MNSNDGVVAEFKNKYGETREIHATRHGLKVKRDKSTVVLTLNPAVSRLVGERIKKHRIKAKMTLAELCMSSGLSSSTPKSRMWEIENNVRGEGLRFGTLFAIALALDIEATDLLPTNDEVRTAASIKKATMVSLSIE